MVGKPRTYETDDGNVTVSVRPESISPVEAGTRDRWVAETAERTLERIDAFDDEANEYARMAREQYGEDLSAYKKAVVAALESLEDDSASDIENQPETSIDETPEP